MSEISRAALFGKLNPLVYKTIEGATLFCKLRGNPYVELVHWLTQLLRRPNDSDTAGDRAPLSMTTPPALARDITVALDKPAARLDLVCLTSPSTSRTRSSAPGSTARCRYGDGAVRSGYLLLGILRTNSLRNALIAISRRVRSRSTRCAGCWCAGCRAADSRCAPHRHRTAASRRPRRARSRSRCARRSRTKRGRAARQLVEGDRDVAGERGGVDLIVAVRSPCMSESLVSSS